VTPLSNNYSVSTYNAPEAPITKRDVVGVGAPGDADHGTVAEAAATERTTTNSPGASLIVERGDDHLGAL
jgi:hypothetical protein